MPSDPVELTKQIKAASDIVAVVGSYLAVKPAGAVYKSLCPFHNDSRPSLDLDPKRQRYRCWACGAHGDVIKFVQQMEKVGFMEARAILASRAGIKLDANLSPQDRHRIQLLDVMRWAAAQYQHALLESPLGSAAVKYIASRKLRGEIVRAFGLGYAPDLRENWLGQRAEADGIPAETLVEVGLLSPRLENRGLYERFRDRIMFPIRDVRGQVIAFGGRIMPESPYASRAPKYYNSTETPLFSKSDVLYGLDLARHAGASEGYLAVVEGYTDVLMAHQCGVAQVVATMGTALNARHITQLKRSVSRVVLVYDADAGGITGVDRALELFVSHDVELAVAMLPDGLDPCDLLVRSGGVETFKKVLASAVDALDFKLNRLLEREGASSLEGTRRIVDEVLGIMAAAPAMAVLPGTAPVVPNRAAQVKQELIITRLAQRLGIRQETVWARLDELRKERRKKEQLATLKAVAPAAPDGATPGPPAELGPPKGAAAGKAVATERNLLELLLAEPAMVPTAAATISPETVTHTGLRRILSELYAAQDAGLVPDVDVLRERLIDRQDLYEAALKLQFVGQHMQDRRQWLSKILKRFAEMKAEDEQRALLSQLPGASDDQVAALFKQLQESHKARKDKPGPSDSDEADAN